MDWLRDELATMYESEIAKVIKDPWLARDEYIKVILKRTDETIRKFMREHCTVEVEQKRVLRPDGSQRNAMLMYTSCGWFFDEISGIETTQIMQYACRAIQLMNQIIESEPGGEISETTEAADQATWPRWSNGSQVYHRFVVPSRTNLQRVGMHYAVASIFEEDPESFPVFNYTTQNEVFVRKEAGEQKLGAWGVTKVKSNVTRSEKRFAFAVIYMGQHNIIGNISLDMEDEKIPYHAGTDDQSI